MTKKMTEQKFKDSYKTIIDFEDEIRYNIKSLIRAADKLYRDGSKAGLFNNKKYEKYLNHLDDICFGENF